MAFTQVQNGTRVTATSTISPTFNTPTAGNLVVACLAANKGTFTAPANWVKAAAISGSTTARAEVWFWNPSGDGITGGNNGTALTPTFSNSTAGCRAYLQEYSVASGNTMHWISAASGTNSGTSAATSFPVTINPTPSGSLCISEMAMSYSSSNPSGNYNSPGTGWVFGRGASIGIVIDGGYDNTAIPAGSQTPTPTFSNDTNMTAWCIAAAVFYEIGTIQATAAFSSASSLASSAREQITLSLSSASQLAANVNERVTLPFSSASSMTARPTSRVISAPWSSASSMTVKATRRVTASWSSASSLAAKVRSLATAAFASASRMSAAGGVLIHLRALELSGTAQNTNYYSGITQNVNYYSGTAQNTNYYSGTVS